MIRFCSFAAGLAVAVAIGAVSANAEVVKPSDVKIVDGKIEKSLTGKPGDPEAGKNWFVNRKKGNCLACHVNKDASKEQFHGEVGPELNNSGGHHSAAELRAIVVNSKAVFGDATIMPAFYRDSGYYRLLDKFEGKTILSAQEVEDIVAYLLTLKE